MDKELGEFPGFLYFGGDSELRGYDYLEFLGNKGFFTNAELRFPLIEAALTPVGVIGGLRGIAFVNLGAAGLDGVPMKLWTNEPIVRAPLLGFALDPFSQAGVTPVFGPPASIPGFKLLDGRASYGIGLETFALGFPVHFDWAWRTLFNRQWEDVVFAFQGLQEGQTRAASGSENRGSPSGSDTTSDGLARSARDGRAANGTLQTDRARAGERIHRRAGAC